MVVRDQHRVELRQVGQRHRHRVVAPRTDAARRRDPVAPHRVGEHPVALELEQHGGVAEPGRGELTGLLRQVRGLELRRVRAACPSALGGELRGHAGGAPLRRLGRGQPVVEQPVVELRRAAVVELAHPGTHGASYAPGGGEQRGQHRCRREADTEQRKSWARHRPQCAAPPNSYRSRTTNRLAPRPLPRVHEQLTTARGGHARGTSRRCPSSRTRATCFPLGSTAPIVRCHRPLCRTTVRSTFPTWEAVTSTAPAPEPDVARRDPVLARRHLRHHVDPTATEIRGDAELVVHDRPEDPVGAPRLQRHRPLGEQLARCCCRSRATERSPASRPGSSHTVGSSCTRALPVV